VQGLIDSGGVKAKLGCAILLLSTTNGSSNAP
jgi:hypothetical protein